MRLKFAVNTHFFDLRFDRRYGDAESLFLNRGLKATAAKRLFQSLTRRLMTEDSKLH